LTATPLGKDKEVLRFSRQSRFVAAPAGVCDALFSLGPLVPLSQPRFYRRDSDN
jgi:hypothetical protein